MRDPGNEVVRECGYRRFFLVECFIFQEMDNNFKFKTTHVSIVQRSSSVVNSFTSSVELIQAMAYKIKRDTIQNFEKINVQF